MPRKKCQNEETRRAIKRDEEITQRLNEDGKKKREDIKILLLGPSGCGKSTFVKAARLLHLGEMEEKEFSEDHRRSLKSAILTSIVELMHNIIKRLDESDAFLEHEFLEPHILHVLATTTSYEQEILDPKLSTSLRRLWEEDLIRGKGYGMVEDEGSVVEYAAKHYLDDLDRISSSDYIPSPQDVVKLHIPTQGIEETLFKIGTLNLTFFEVGHMISERRKWLPYTDNLDSVIFMVPYALYDCGVGEDPLSNPLRAALCEFDTIMKSQHEWLQHKSIMLLFSGADKFKKKLPSKPLKSVFPDFEGPETLRDASKYIQDLFLSVAQDRNPNQRVYPFFTASLDQTNIRFLLSIMQDDLLPPICQPRPVGL